MLASLLLLLAATASPLDDGRGELDGGAGGDAGGTASVRAAGAGEGDAGTISDAGGASGDGAPAAEAPTVAEAGVEKPAARIRVRGTVLARGVKEPLAGATIAVDTVAAGESEADGRFELEVVPGRRRLQIQFPGYEPFETVLEAAPAQVPPALTIRLQPRMTGDRYETVVAAPASEAEAVGLDQEEIRRTPGSLGDPFRVIESLPGVTQIAFPLALYAVRGANPGNTGFFVDGIRLPALFHFALGPAVIHPYFLEKLDFYPGGYPARYGRFVSGVVAAQTATPKTDRPRGSVDVRLYDAGGIVATPFDDGRGAVAVAGRYSYSALLFSAFSPDMTLEYWDYQLRLDYRLGPGRVTLFAFGGRDLIASKENPDLNGDLLFHRLNLRWEGVLGPGRLRVGATAGVDSAAAQLQPFATLPISTSSRSLAPRLSYTIPWPLAELEVGGDAEVQRFRPFTEREDANEQDLFRDRTVIAAGGYAAATLRPTPRLLITPGLRADVFLEEDVQVTEVQPRLHLRFSPDGETWIKAAGGRFAQMASLPVAVPGFDGFGLGSFGTQTSSQVSLGVERSIGDALALDVTGFYQRLLLTDLLSQFGYDPTAPNLLELREGESYGVEVMLRRPGQHRFFGWLAYTLSWSQRLVGAAKSKFWSDWDQRHVLNLVAGYRMRGGYSLGSRFHLNTGRPYPVVELSDPSFPDYQRLPTFYRLDLRAEKRFVFDSYVIDLYLEIVNLTSKREVLDRKTDNGEVIEKAFELALPSLGIHAEW